MSRSIKREGSRGRPQVREVTEGVFEPEPRVARGRTRKDGATREVKYEEGIFQVNEAGETAREPLSKPQEPITGAPDLSVEFVRRGVSVSWLSGVLGMERLAVTTKLKPVTPMAHHAGQPVYDLRTALPHLLDPIQDIETYIRKMGPEMLPSTVQTEYWRAEKLRLQTLEMARQLWNTDKVLEGYAHIFRIVRDQTSLWLDNLQDVEEMSDEQRGVVGKSIDGLMVSLYNALEEHTTTHGTSAEVAQIEARLAEVNDPANRDAPKPEAAPRLKKGPGRPKRTAVFDDFEDLLG